MPKCEFIHKWSVLCRMVANNSAIAQLYVFFVFMSKKNMSLCQKEICLYVEKRIASSLVNHVPLQPKLEELVVYLIYILILRDEVFFQQALDCRHHRTR